MQLERLLALEPPRCRRTRALRRAERERARRPAATRTVSPTRWQRGEIDRAVGVLLLLHDVALVVVVGRESRGRRL